MTDKQYTVESLGKAWEEFKDTNDARLKALEAGQGTAEFDAKLTKIDDAMQKYIADRDAKDASLQEQVDSLEEKVAGMRASKDPTKQARAGYYDAFIEYIRAGKAAGSSHAERLQAAGETLNKARTAEGKAVQTTVNADGGFAVPEEIDTAIGDQVRELSPMRDLILAREVGTPDFKELLNIHGEASGWVGETDTRSETATPSLRQRAPTFGTLYAYPKATEESLDDVFFDVGAFLAENVAGEFAIAEATAFLTGNGTNKPTGLLNTAPVVTDDDASPARSAEAIEYVPADTASPAATITADSLITLVYTLRAQYRARGVWAMNSLTTATIRKLKDSQNQYLWAPGLANGQPDTLLGYPLRTLEALADIAADALPVVFGDWSRGYHVADLVGMRVTVDNNLTTPGYVKWYFRKRLGGILFDNNALKCLKIANS